MPKIMLLIVLLSVSCISVTPRQETLARLSSSARAKCVSVPAQCAVLAPCQHAAQIGIVAWLSYSQAVARNEDETKPLAEALVQEGSARLICAEQGIR